MLDHIGLLVSSYKASREFYQNCLKPLGFELIVETEGWAGLGRDDKPDFWFGADATPHQPMHIAFKALDRSAVDQFYLAALAAGGRDNGPPGLREIYHPHYYGAFVLNPDGHNIEAVCHAKS